MRESLFLHIFRLHFKSELKKHIDIFLLSLLMLSILSGVMITSASYRYQIEQLLETKPDFVLQNRVAGVTQKMDESWVDKLYEIRGITDITPRVYTAYKDKVKLLGIDFLQKNANRNINGLIQKINLKKFLANEYALVPYYIKKKLALNNKLIIARKEVAIYPLPKEIDKLIPKNTIILQLDSLREILGWSDEYISDITFNVPNSEEWSMIESKLDSLYYTSLSISKDEIKKAYSKMFGFKEGFFLMIYLIVIAIFGLILYSRYNQLYSTERRVIGILKGVGWSIRDILFFKLLETILIILFSFVVGVGLGYLLLYLFDGAWFWRIFFNDFIEIEPVFDVEVLFSIFLIYAVPFVASVLIPVWRVAITEPKEAML